MIVKPTATREAATDSAESAEPCRTAVSQHAVSTTHAAHSTHRSQGDAVDARTIAI